MNSLFLFDQEYLDAYFAFGTAIANQYRTIIDCRSAKAQQPGIALLLFDEGISLRGKGAAVKALDGINVSR